MRVKTNADKSLLNVFKLKLNPPHSPLLLKRGTSAGQLGGRKFHVIPANHGWQCPCCFYSVTYGPKLEKIL